MLICGIDPGKSGALFFMNSDGTAGRAVDMPLVKIIRGGRPTDIICGHRLAEHLMGLKHGGHAFLEQQWDRPKMSARFALGEGYGLIRGALAALSVPYTMVSPNAWKKALSVPKEKHGAIARASQLLPAYASEWPLKKHDGRAEAALLALYGMTVWMHGSA